MLDLLAKKAAAQLKDKSKVWRGCARSRGVKLLLRLWDFSPARLCVVQNIPNTPGVCEHLKEIPAGPRFQQPKGQNLLLLVTIFFIEEEHLRMKKNPFAPCLCLCSSCTSNIFYKNQKPAIT